MDYILTGVLGFFIGITVCFLYMTCQIKSSDNLKKSLEIGINVGDTVWYQGEKWEVILHDYWSDGSASDIHKFYLRNGWKDVAGVDLHEIKKVIRAD